MKKFIDEARGATAFTLGCILAMFVVLCAIPAIFLFVIIKYILPKSDKAALNEALTKLNAKLEIAIAKLEKVK